MKILSKEQMKKIIGGDETVQSPGGAASPCEGKSPGDSCTTTVANLCPVGTNGTCTSNLQCAVAC